VCVCVCVCARVRAIVGNIVSVTVLTFRIEAEGNML
jgi:hypothetical protein